MVSFQILLIGIVLIPCSIYGQNVLSKPVICSDGNCIRKCCPENQHVLYRSKNCTNYAKPLNISLPVYNDRIELTEKKFEDVFFLEPNAFHNISFKKKVYQLLHFGFNVYITESAILYLEYPNAYNRWMSMSSTEYCIDYLVPATIHGREPKIGAWGVLPASDVIQGNYVFTVGMIISCIFLILVLIVYLLLPELRNIGGLILMAYVFSVLCSFIFLMVIQRAGHSTTSCVALTLTLYFFFLASFCWMNIMSTISGGPSGGEKLLYLYAPMLIMIVLNWLFFLMTAFNIWRLSRGTAVLDAAAAGTPAAHRSHRHRLLVYLKLSILMGLNWILEVVSFFKPDLTIWYFTDAYNLLIGLAIFLIFVCKKKIYKKLKKRLMGHSASTWTQSMKSRSSTRSNSFGESTHLSHDVSMQISINPKGPHSLLKTH
ncbi:hypothetical protein ACJJTC_004844 [Scirpophaga incertulas]